MEKSYAKWSPTDYLAQYYSTANITADEFSITKFVVDFLVEKNRIFSEMLEIGCGPTIHHVIPFVPYVGQIFMTDYLEGNLEEIRKWVLGIGHNWIPYLTEVLALEGQTSELVVQERARMLREKIAGLLSCNVLEAQPLGQPRAFPLVTSFYCLECVGQDKDQWKRAMVNIASLVAPDGWFILSSVRNADKYVVFDREFPTVHIDESDMQKTLIACGFVPVTINVKVHPSNWGEEGFSSILIASAQKQ